MFVEILASPDLETAIADGLWGWRWTAIASVNGVAAAASEPLPERAEEQAQVQAKAFHDLGLPPDLLVLGGSEAWATKALKAYHDALPLLEAVRAQFPTPQLLRETKKTRRAARRLDAAERLGRAAAKACRIDFLAATACADASQPSNRKSYP